MDNKKYKFNGITKIFNGKVLHQIEAIKDFGVVSKGEIGGYIEKEDNLSQDGECWIRGRSMVIENAKVSGDALIIGNVMIFGNAKISGKPTIRDNVIVTDNTVISGRPIIEGNASILDNAKVSGDAKVFGHAKVCEHADISGSASIYGNAKISGYTIVSGLCEISGNAIVSLNYDKCYRDEMIVDNFDICNDSLITNVYKDVFYINTSNFYKEPITFTRQANSRIFVNIRGFFNDDIDKFVDYVTESKSDKEIQSLKEEFEMLVKFVKLTMKKDGGQKDEK